MPDMDLATALRASRAGALTLGVPAGVAGGAARRLRAARRIRAEHHERSNAAYDQSCWPVEPDVPAPFGLYELIREQGDVQRVVTAPDFALTVLNHLGRGYREEIRPDEDGTRWVAVAPTTADYRAAAQEAASIRAELAACGHLPRRNPGRPVVYRFTPPAWSNPGTAQPWGLQF